SFFATEGPSLGVEVTAGDFDGDGRAEIVAAVSGPAAVEVFDSRTLLLLRAFAPYAGYSSRVDVDAFALDGSGRDVLLTVSASGTADAIVSDPITGAQLARFIAFPSARPGVPR